MLIIFGSIILTIIALIIIIFVSRTLYRNFREFQLRKIPNSGTESKTSVDSVTEKVNKEVKGKKMKISRFKTDELIKDMESAEQKNIATENSESTVSSL